MGTHYMDYKEVGEQNYYISTADTFDVGWETMVFTCDEDCRVTDWCEKYKLNYANESAAVNGHKYVIESLEYCLKTYER